MALIELAGAAGAGKTTVCRLLPYQCREVEAPRCWIIEDPVARQLCFLSEFYRLLSAPAQGIAVASNSMVTVYGYSAVLAAGNPVLLRAAALAADLASPAVIVLTADPGEIEERIRKRMAGERRRAISVVEKDIELHIRAQEEIVTLAVAMGYPVVDTTGRSPGDVAEEVRSIIAGMAGR